MDCCDNPWFFAIVWAFCFAEDAFFCHQNLIANFVIIINLLTVLACRVKISLALPVISYFVPDGYERNVEEHVTSEYCRAWRGFKDCMIGRANGPCPVVKEDIDIIGVTVSAMLSSAVCNICAKTWCKCSKIAFACRFFILVGLRFIPCVVYRYSKFNLNSLPLL